MASIVRFHARDFARTTLVAAPIALMGIGAQACARDENQVTAPSDQLMGLSAGGAPQPDLDSALAVHRRYTMRLMDLPGVVGTAVGLTDAGRPAITLFTEDRVVGLPDSLEGI